MQFGKHDEGKNASFQDLDKEAWVMFMSSPSNAKNNDSISKAISGFGLLPYWHDTNNEARIVVKVNLSDGAKIPHVVLVSAGMPPKARSWMCPAYVLKYKSVTMLGDETPTTATRPLFPLPIEPPRWLGLFAPAPPDADGHGSGSSTTGQDLGSNAMATWWWMNLFCMMLM